MTKTRKLKITSLLFVQRRPCNGADCSCECNSTAFLILLHRILRNGAKVTGGFDILREESQLL